MLRESILSRLRSQLGELEASFPQTPADSWNRKPTTGKWSAQENLAHLGRYHEVFLERVGRILKEDKPRFARYRAEEDSEWSAWMTRDYASLQARIPKLRREIIERLGLLSEDQLTRTGIHPVLGEMNILQWTEFFLLHEAHHLYTILFRLREPA